MIIRPQYAGPRVSIVTGKGPTTMLLTLMTSIVLTPTIVRTFFLQIQGNNDGISAVIGPVQTKGCIAYIISLIQ